MRHSLFFKLAGAFALVIAVLAAVASILAGQATADEFRTYRDRNGEALAQALASALSNYYAQENSWTGVEALLQGPLALPGGATPSPTWNSGANFVTVTAAAPGGMRHGNTGMGMGMVQTPDLNPTAIAGSGSMGSRMSGGHSASADSGVWAMMGQRVIVADASGRVVSDSSGQLPGTLLSPEQLQAGESIQVSGQSAGTVLVGAGEAAPGTPAGEFLQSINRSIRVAVLAAGGVAMLVGGALFFQITAPVRKLEAAAVAIARGDLTQRVAVPTQDELGSLAIAFNHMAENLSRAEDQRKQMVADVAHELRTPLSVMQANLEAMQDGMLPLNAEEIASLHEETALLGRLVADLHLLSQAETGQLKLERAEVDPRQVIRRAAERLDQRAQQGGVTISLETSTAPSTLWVDAGRISQVIGNLISNSLRYTAPGGTVTVKVEKHPATALEPAEVWVSVTDSGTGIAPADLPHVFDRFYRADKSRARNSGGSGLGLAIVKHIVEAHGGRVWAESPPTQDGHAGTRITLALPARPAE